MVESLFKAFAKAVDFACQKDPRIAGQLPSTKGNVSAMAMVAAGKLEYQIKGQNSVSVEANEEVPLETDVKI
jgi:hypothetical protein